MLVAVATTFSFTSCEDVPEAYQLPTAGAGGEGAGGEEGAGTIDNPYTVNAIKKGGVTGTAYLKAYIVGFVPEKAISEAKFSAEGCEATSNVIVAASADETNVNNVMAIQLPTGAVRDGVNLKDNPTNLKQEVILYGNVENYFGQVGMKSVTWAKIGDKEFGTQPGGGETGGDATVGDVFEYDVTSAGFTEDTKLTEITLTNGLTITFDGGGNSSAPVFNLKFKNFRFYPKNTMKFNSTKKIASIKFLCDKGQTTICNASGDISSTSGTTSIDGNYLVISGINEQNFTLTNVSTKTKEPSQLRFTKIIITFAK